MSDESPIARPERSTSEERLRRRLLDAAQSLVEAQGGLRVSLDQLSLDQVLNHAGVSRSSAYRVWPNKHEFNLDVLCDLAGPSWQGTAAFDEATIKLARDIVAERLGDLATAEGRRRVLVETIRQAAQQNYEAVVKSGQWRTYVALTATVLSIPQEHADDRKRILDALQTAELTFLSKMADFYSDMSIILGVRLKPHVPDFVTLAAAGASVVEGLSLRQLLASAVVQTPLEDVDEDGQRWHLAALGFLGVFDKLVEPVSDDKYSLQDAVATYLKRLSERERQVAAADN